MGETHFGAPETGESSMSVVDFTEYSDAELEEQLVMDASVWRGIRMAIIPSLFMWALIGFGVELARALLP